MADEVEEVYALLSRHRLTIIRELNQTNLIQILVKNSVVNVEDEELINSEVELEKRCDQLIEIVAKDGFEKFKQFCYAIETECSQLISDLINDKLSQSNEDSKEDTTALINDNYSIENGRETIDSNRSRRSTSYCGSATPTPVPNSPSRRSSLVCSSPPAPSSVPPPIPQLPAKSAVASNSASDYGSSNKPKNYGESKFSVSNSNFASPSANNQNDDNRNSHGQNSGSRLSQVSPYSYLQPKRFSSPSFGDYAYDKGVNVKNRTSSIVRSKSKKEQRNYHSMNETIEVLADQVVEDDRIGERTSWDYNTVTLSRVPGYGFGIAVSGGRDNPHFANGDPSIAVSDVLKHGPAEGQLQVNDRIISVNGISLENVEYATAVQVLRDSGNTVTLVVKRRVPNHALMQPTGSNALAGGVGVNSHQHQHSISSTGLGLGALVNNGSQQQIKVIVTKASKKDDFGIVLGCRLFIKEISSKTKDQLAANGYSLQEGDLVTRIHNTNCNDSMSLKEAKKIIDGCKERLTLAVLRDSTNATLNAGLGGGTSSGMQSPVYSHTAQVSNCSNMDENYLNGNSGIYSGQNLYVQPPTRPSAMSTLLVDDKSNLTPRGRSRGPLTDISLQQLDRPSTPQGASSSRDDGAGSGHTRSRSTVDEPPRPPPPRGEDFYSTRRPLHDEKPTSEPRYITFQKEGSVGIRLTGGNEVGIFVTAVQQNSPAAAQGLVPGDKILKVNDMDMNGVTREEAVLFLLSLQDRIDLIVQYCKEEYDNITAQQRGDSFHIKTHFHCENPSKGELSFKAGDVFRVIDTLYNGVVGAWQVLRIGHGHQELQRGVIPNKARAEELATAQFNATKKEMNASESRVSFFRRKRSTHRRSKSLSRENWDDVVFSDSISKFPAYERVVLRHPGFVRPVVLFGPVSDIARERLVKDFSDKYTAPLQDDDKGSKCGGIVRLSNIRDIMDRGKHALLDITPNAVDRLNYAQFYPIVIFLKADTKHSVKQLRQGLPKSQHKSSKKLFEQCQKLERVWSHVFSATISLNDPDTWYRKLRDTIDQQQSGAVWMSETKPVESLSDDFLFPMTTSRLSYASSPESDLELSPGPSASLSLGNLPQLVKSSSDPSIATNQDNLDRDRELGDGMPPPYTNPYDHSAHPRRMTVDNKYGFSSKNNIGAPIPPDEAIYGSSRPPPPIQHNNTSHFGPVPDLPPRIDRASKPLNTVPPSTPGSSLPSRNSSTGGTLGRSAQERLFGNKASTDNLDQVADDYATRSQMLNAAVQDKRGAATSNGLNSLERAQNTSLDRTRPNQPPGHATTPSKANGSYDSVSSYDSYNTSQLTAQNMRLGPNAPDDLKSVPNGRSGTGLAQNQSNVSDYNRTSGNNDLLMTPPRGGHMHPDRNNFNGTHDALTPRNSGERSTGMNIPQRPSNLALESPRKHIIETKTDYGKYSRNNSASQADYSKPNKVPPPMLGTPPANGSNGAPFKPVPPPKPKNYRPPIGGGGSSGNGPMNSGQWENGEPISPRSPNGFYYPPMSSHYHQGVAHNVPSSPNNNHMNVSSGHPSQMHPYGQYGGNAYNGYNGNNNGGQSHYMGNSGRDMGMGPNNGYNSNAHHPYGNNYMHRGSGGPNHGIGNMPMHPSERHPLDLAGSREQRGSAFELYRKPQLGTAGHHHNIREMEPMMSIHEFNQHQQNLMYQERLRQQQQQPLPPIPGSSGYDMYSRNIPHPGLPPELPAKPSKKNILRSPLKAIKNVFIKSTRPLRRQVSLADADKKLRPILKRQHSMMEPRSSSRMMDTRFQEAGYDPRQYYTQQQYYGDPRQSMSPPPPQQSMRGGYHMHEPYHPKDPNSTYQNLETESIYGNYGGAGGYYDQEQENLYANRALIELERSRPGLVPGSGSNTTGRRIVRRHSMADRSAPSPSFSNINRRRMGSERYQMEMNTSMNDESIYQSKSGSYMYNDSCDPNRRIMDEPVYQSRREMHRDHLYQSKKQMQDRIQQSRLEMIQNQHRDRSESPGSSGRIHVATESSSSSPNSPSSSTYSTRKEMKEKGIKPRTQLRDQIYQSRREAMESMAEPDYISRRELKHEPIYESKNEIDGACSQEFSKLQINEDTLDSKPEVISEHSNINPSESCTNEADATPIATTEISDIHSKAPLALSEDDDEEETLTKINESDLQKATASKASTPLSSRATHISNFLKRTGPPPPAFQPPPPPITTAPPAPVVSPSAAEVYASRTSIETQYTSQMSLPIGPPNAHSTPFASEMSLGLPPPRQPITRRGVFDASGGTLADPIWNVSLQIPPGAIPGGIKQEIYFTVTDPRLSESVGGPPLDMENGETMLSPLVMCGPQGTEFLQPVTLNIPHCAGRTTSLGLSLKATDSEKNLQTDWDNIELPSNAAAHTVSVKVDHF